MYGQQKVLSFSATKNPIVFAPGIISNGLDNRDMTISPSNDELYYTLQQKSGSIILYCKKTGNRWSKPEVAWFSGKFSDMEPAFSPDGKKLFFASNRPLKETDSLAKDYDLWCIEKKNNQWIQPFNLGTAINTEKDEYYPSIASNRNLYFTRDNGDTKDDIFISKNNNGQFETPLVLPKEINSAGYDFNAFIDPEESFIIFSSYKRKDDLGGGDLYISRRKENVWQPAIHFEKGINSPALDYSPFISFDKKYLFFTSKRSSIKFPLKNRKSLKEIEQQYLSHSNGSDDIYMVSMDAIRELLQ